jgi:hypothetical protein
MKPGNQFTKCLLSAKIGKHFSSVRQFWQSDNALSLITCLRAKVKESAMSCVHDKALSA